jgi:flagellar hook protein FlgE
MFESMYIGISGLTSYSRGLNVISNNLANMNTAGFKGSTMSFGDLFYRQQATGSGDGAAQWSQFGTGVRVMGTQINFRAGELRQTGNALDLAIDGTGYLVTRSEGSQHYTRAGQLAFDGDGFLVASATGRRVAGYGPDGALADVSLDGLRTHAPTATTSVVLKGNLSSSPTSGTTSEFTLQPINVIDGRGGQHALRAVFTSAGTSGTGGADGTWNVKVHSSAGEIGSGTVRFIGMVADPAASSFNVTFTPPGAPAFTFSLALGSNATSFSTGSTSTLAVDTQDGVAVGSLVSVTIDQEGFVVASYSNGKTRQGQQLALAGVATETALQAVENGEFALRDPAALTLGRPGQGSFGKFSAGQVEGSNVDLATEFTDLIVMQRGYQASSRIVSTANDLIQELFDMKGHR